MAATPTNLSLLLTCFSFQIPTVRKSAEVGFADALPRNVFATAMCSRLSRSLQKSPRSCGHRPRAQEKRHAGLEANRRVQLRFPQAGWLSHKERPGLRPATAADRP